MRKSTHLYRWLAGGALAALLLGWWAPASAQVAPPDPTPAAGAEAAAAADAVTFAQLGYSERTLNGSAQTVRLVFGLPATWALTDEVELQLNLTTFVSVNGSPAPAAAAGGTLAVLLNERNVGTVEIDGTGDTVVVLPVPKEALASVRADGRHELAITLNSNATCSAEFTQETSVAVRESSRLVLPHTLIPPSTALSGLPRPLYQGTFLPDAATIVVPDRPALGELRSALTVAAGLGRLTGGRLDLDLTTAGKLTGAAREGRHLIFVGQARSFPMLRDVSLPAPVGEAGYDAEGAAPGDGVIQMAVSPWDESQVVLVVGGASEAAVLRAGQALGTGSVRAGAAPNLALVGGVGEPAAGGSQAVDRTLADLGYSTRMLQQSSASAEYRFGVPVGQVAGEGAYLDLVFNHTALVDFEQSGVAVSLNGVPIGSLRFSERSTSVTSARVAVPASAVRQGTNVLAVRASFVPRAACVDVRQIDIWMTIWPESGLHLPLAAGGVTPRQTLDLGAFPAPFTQSPSLASTAFVVAQGAPESWAVAARLAFELGRRSTSAVADLDVAFAESVPAELRLAHDLVLIGRPRALPLLAELGDRLPAPFAPGSDTPDERGAQVSYRLPDGASAGYLQLAAAPWSDSRLVLAVLGTTDEGVRWAGRALTDTRLRGRLTGTFVTVDEDRLTPGNERSVVLGVAPAPTPTAAPAPTQQATGAAAPAGAPAAAPAAPTAAPAAAPLAVAPPPPQNEVSPLVPVALALVVLTIAVGLVSWAMRRS